MVMTNTETKSQALISELWRHLLQGRFQIHPKGHSNETEQGEGEGAHGQLQAQAHHHVSMAGITELLQGRLSFSKRLSKGLWKGLQHLEFPWFARAPTCPG